MEEFRAPAASASKSTKAVRYLEQGTRILRRSDTQGPTLPSFERLQHQVQLHISHLSGHLLRCECLRYLGSNGQCSYIETTANAVFRECNLSRVLRRWDLACLTRPTSSAAAGPCLRLSWQPSAVAAAGNHARLVVGCSLSFVQ